MKAFNRVLRVISFFRWVFNFFFVAIPWFWIGLMLIFVNFTLNIILNNFWSYGNIGLIINTWYLVVQTIHSWLLVIEIPFLLKNNFIKVFRVISFFSSWAYLIFYAFITFDWIYELFLEGDDQYYNYQLIDVILNMYMGYNIIFNLHIMPVNIVIICHETWMIFFPPLLEKDQHGSSLLAW